LKKWWRGKSDLPVKMNSKVAVREGGFAAKEIEGEDIQQGCPSGKR